MSVDGQSDDPGTRPLPAQPPSPYAPAGSGQPYAPPGPYAPYGQAPTQEYARPSGQTPPLPNGQAPTQPYGQTPTQPYGGPPPTGTGRRRGWRSPRVLIPLVVVVVVVLGLAASGIVLLRHRHTPLQSAPSGTPSATGAASKLPPGRTWLSGAWTGGKLSAAGIEGFGAWRGQAADVVTTYPAYDTWSDLKNSDWFVGTFDGYQGKLSYGLPLLPKDGTGSLADVAAGKYDDVWASIAQILNKHGRYDSYVRIGLEANGESWFRWGSTASGAATFKAAFRRVETVMKAISPKLKFGFDITCGHPLSGGTNRLDSLTQLYPGDDVVDDVGCDDYDSGSMQVDNAAEWQHTLHPSDAVGLDDVAAFAREHHKKMVVPEWGLTAVGGGGSGDNPFFIYSMYQFFLQNKDVLAYEDYFNEPAPPPDYVGSALWGGDNPKSAAEYKKLWGAAPHLTSSSG